MKKLVLIGLLAFGFGFGQGWEYASLVVERRSYVWTEPGRVFESSQPALLYREFTGTTAGPTDDHFMNLLNVLGGRGWELAGPVTIEGTTRFVFKRPISAE